MRRFAGLPLLLLRAAPAFAIAPEAPPVLEGIYSRAEVAGPRGAFVTEMVTLADGRARFVQVHPGRRSEVVVAGGLGFARDPAGAFAKGEATTAAFVLAHDVPRLAGTRGGRPDRLELAAPEALGGGSIAVELGDWKSALFDLPFSATFVDARKGGEAERFVYRYTAILPFRLAPGTELPADPASLFSRLGDLGELVAAHERVMEAHRRSDAAMLTANAPELAISSGRGKLTFAKLDDFRQRMSGYLGAIRFDRYVDTVVPVVAVSADGTLGWLACEMDAAGTRTEGGRSVPIAYGFSWVELAAKGPDGSWRAIGNASSARP